MQPPILLQWIWVSCGLGQLSKVQVPGAGHCPAQPSGKQRGVMQRGGQGRSTGAQWTPVVQTASQGGRLQPPPLQQSTGAAVTPVPSDICDLHGRYNRGFHHPCCGDKCWPLPPQHLCPYTAKIGRKRVSAGESSFQEHILRLSHHCWVALKCLEMGATILAPLPVAHWP